MKVPATVVERFSFECQGYDGWFMATITKYIVESGELITHFGSPQECEVGDNVILSATVKKHDEYKGVNQTSVSRPHHAKQKAK